MEGVVLTRTARYTGTVVYLEDMGKDYPDGRWMTVCDNHSGCGRVVPNLSVQ